MIKLFDRMVKKININKRVMIVDDEPDVLISLKTVLERQNYDVITVTNGSECLKEIEKGFRGVILMDIMMPTMSGRETTEKIRTNSKTKNLKVAFLTVARFSEVGKDELKKMNVVDYITKPFDNNDLVKRVKRLVG